MTIVTKPLNGGDKKNSKEKECLNGNVPDVAVNMVTQDDDLDGDDTNYPSTTMRKALIVSQVFLLLTGILAIFIGVIFGAHLYRQLNGRNYYRSFCRIPTLKVLGIGNTRQIALTSGNFHNADYKDNRITIGGHFQGEKEDEIIRPQIEEIVEEKLKVKPVAKEDGSIEFDFELDLDFEEFESFEFPEISSGRYFHDFKSNKTAIVDMEGNRCFVMPLNREEITPPRNLYDMILKMRNGEYDLDLDEIRHDMRAVLPPIKDLYDYGYFIINTCYNKKTYRLEEVMRVRRSVVDDEDQSDFAEFTGKHVVRYAIQNLKDLE